MWTAKLFMNIRLFSLLSVALLITTAVNIPFIHIAHASQRRDAATLQNANPSAVAMSADQLSRIDGVVDESISKKELPGAVVLIARHGKIVWRKAYGNRALQPATEPMTV